MSAGIHWATANDSVRWVANAFNVSTRQSGIAVSAICSTSVVTSWNLTEEPAVENQDIPVLGR